VHVTCTFVSVPSCMSFTSSFAVSPHKATCGGCFPPYRERSWPCAEKRHDAACVPDANVSITHAAWDVDAGHGVHATYSVRKPGTACADCTPNTIHVAGQARTRHNGRL
jgi:hypothetical protein